MNVSYEMLKNKSLKELEAILSEVIDKAQNIDEEAVKNATKRQEELAKPPGALGTLEEISIKLAGITGSVKNKIEKKAIVICSSDNGVVAEGVTPTPQSVTMAQTINFTKGTTGVAAIARGCNIDLCVLDLGVNADFPENLISKDISDFANKKIIDRKLKKGTDNLAEKDAMSKEHCILAILCGVEAMGELKKRGYDIVGTGEMGIGNTTTSACVLSAITKCSEIDSVGRGGGLNDAGFERKREIVMLRGVEASYGDVLQILTSVGGFDICGMVGLFIGAALYKIPIVIDGYISSVAALAATKLCDKTKNFMFASHISEEAGYKIAMENIGISGILDLHMRLGEGSGCPMAFEVISCATHAMNYMATYDEAQIDENYLELMADAKF